MKLKVGCALCLVVVCSLSSAFMLLLYLRRLWIVAANRSLMQDLRFFGYGLLEDGDVASSLRAFQGRCRRRGHGGSSGPECCLPGIHPPISGQSMLVRRDTTREGKMDQYRTRRRRCCFTACMVPRDRLKHGCMMRDI